MPNEQAYFVHQLGPDDYRPVPDAVYEIQILNADGQGERSAYLGAQSADILCAVSFVTPPGPTRIDPSELHIPEPVIAAARQRRVGFGERVNARGEILLPF